MPESWRVLTGDCLAVLATLDADSIDACVTDPPYGLGFMGREWDTFAPDTVAAYKDRMRPVKPDETNPNVRGRAKWWGGGAVEYDRSAAASLKFHAWTQAWAEAQARSASMSARDRGPGRRPGGRRTPDTPLEVVC